MSIWWLSYIVWSRYLWLLRGILNWSDLKYNFFQSLTLDVFYYKRIINSKIVWMPKISVVRLMKFCPEWFRLVNSRYFSLPTDLLIYSNLQVLPYSLGIWCGRVCTAKYLNSIEYVESEHFGFPRFPASLDSSNILLASFPAKCRTWKLRLMVISNTVSKFLCEPSLPTPGSLYLPWMPTLASLWIVLIFYLGLFKDRRFANLKLL